MIRFKIKNFPYHPDHFRKQFPFREKKREINNTQSIDKQLLTIMAPGLAPFSCNQFYENNLTLYLRDLHNDCQPGCHYKNC
jgi:hypothetical protein